MAHRPGAPHSTTARRVSAVRSFYTYAHAQGAVVHNRAARRPRLTNAAQLTPSGLDPWQTAVLLAAVDRRSSQDRACCYLQLGLGLRSGLLVTLTLDDLLSGQDIGRGLDTLRCPNPTAATGWSRSLPSSGTRSTPTCPTAGRPRTPPAAALSSPLPQASQCPDTTRPDFCGPWPRRRGC
ncbi:hypothetical protein [Streptomyces sp. NPDC006527]|uniref:hypothetical protein n=1 Tax=Streptomyces sp. NPDC006527 TaxID=3364749 RepID=UPI00368B9542